MTELKIFIGMSRVLNRINKATGKIHAKYGLTSAQFAVLEALYHKGDLCIGDVQEKILSTSGTIPVIVKNLEKQEYVEKINDEKDRRRYILHITEKGKKLMDKVYPENEEIIVSMISTLNKNEQREMLKKLKILGGFEHEKNDKR